MLITSISPFPKCFLPFTRHFIFLVTLILSAHSFSLDQSQILLFGEELSHYQMTNFREELAYDNFKLNENSRKLSKWVENNVGKGEIARYEQFLLFPQCFQKACVKRCGNGLTDRSFLSWVLLFISCMESQ